MFAAVAMVGLFVAFSSMKTAAASPAGPEQIGVEQVPESRHAPDAQANPTDGERAPDEQGEPATPKHDPARFGKLDYEPPMDAESVSRRANSGGDIVCPGTEPCGP